MGNCALLQTKGSEVAEPTPATGISREGASQVQRHENVPLQFANSSGGVSDQLFGMDHHCTDPASVMQLFAMLDPQHHVANTVGFGLSTWLLRNQGFIQSIVGNARKLIKVPPNPSKVENVIVYFEKKPGAPTTAKVYEDGGYGEPGKLIDLVTFRQELSAEKMRESIIAAAQKRLRQIADENQQAKALAEQAKATTQGVPTRADRIARKAQWAAEHPRARPAAA